MKIKHYTPFFQTIYLFHFLFILSDIKNYGMKFKALQMIFQM
jgi:hypothetical protein